ncbi:hypothetical protein DS742_26220 [Lacrimispora amygdalina]|uniref:Phage tail tape measure protein domain-containing protein n=1 Tax=Lacrimispora amygdalina TaxID=253257 RepID=A0A3E2N4M2_9FIRM|nr:hypothetical protein [Clostridium indicum]RFZ75938.1 hypothetical protein DS742_26220 [Clostridium indicum]
MAVQWDSKSGLGGWIVDIYKAKKGIVDVSAEADKFFTKYKNNGKDLSAVISNVFENNGGEKGIDGFIKDSKLADESLIKFLKDSKQGTKDLASYQEYLKTTGKQTSRFADLTQKAGNVVKGFGAALASMAVMWAIGQVVSVAVKAIDSYVNRVKIAKEAVADAKGNFDSLRSELQSINEELETNKDRISELNELPSLTYVEQGELDKLKEATKELERQRDIKDIELKRAAEDLSESNRDAFDKEYGDNNFNYSDVMGLDSQYGSLSMSPTSDVALAQEGLEGLAAAIVKVQEAQKQAQENGDSEWLDSLTEREKSYKQQLEDNLSSLQGYRDNLTDLMNYRDLTEDEQKFYDNLEQGIRLIYQFTDPSAWNQIEFDQIFNNESIDVTKEKLIELASAGKLDEDTIKQFPKLSEAIKNIDLILGDGETATKSFIDQIVALARESKDAGSSVESAFAPLSKQEVITNINSLSEGFESLDKIMKSISDEDNPFDYALLDDKNFKEKFGDLGESYTDFIEKVSSSPKDIQATQSAFDNLVTTWIDSSGVLDGLTDENANLATAMLQNMGISNAEEVVTNRLAIAQSELAAEKYYNANASDTLNNATISEIDAFVNSGIAAGISEQALAELALQKLAVNDVKIDTSSDIDQVIGLANAAGASAAVLSKLAQAKAIMAKAEAGALNGSVGDLRQYESAQAMLAEIENGTFDFQTTLDPEKYKKTVYTGGTKTNKSGGSGSKKDKTDTSKDIDWIDRQLKLLEEKRSQLVNKISDTYSDFSSTTHDQILELDKTLINEYTNAVNQYQSEYDKAVSKISAQNKAKIENGSMSVDTLSGKELEYVQAAIDAYDKLTGTQVKQSEAHKTLLDDIKSKYDDISKSIENENNKLKDSNSILESQMEYYKSAGIVVDSSYYNRLIQNTSGLISNTRDTISNKRAELRDLLANGADTSSQEYLDLKSEIADAETNVYALKKAQEEYNNQLKQMPIDHLSTIISMYDDITAKIENWGSVQTATGGKLNTEYYQTLISNGATVIDQYKKQIREIKSLMSESEKGSTVWQELYSQLQSIDSATASMVNNLQKWNEELLKMPLDNISTYSDSLQKVISGLTNVQSEYNSIITAITDAISDQISVLEDQQKIAADAQQSEIDALQEKYDLLVKTNEKLKLQMALEQSQYNLARSLSQKVNTEVRNGEVVWVEDYDAVRKAQEENLDAQFNIDKYSLEQQIEDAKTALDNLNDSYQDQIDALEEISKKYSEISSAAEKISNANLATSLFGEGWADKVLSGNDKEIYSTLTSLYQTNAEQLEQYQKQADSTENIYSLLEDYVNSYKSGEITYEQAMTKINGLLSQMNESMSAMDNLQNIYDYLGTVNGVGADADSILKGIQDGLSVTADELVKSLEQYNKNSGMISEYSSSWEQLTDNVKSMLDVLKEVRDNLRDDEDDSDDDDDEPYDKSRGKGWGTGDVNNGPGVYADGIENGPVGKSSDSEREKMLKYLATNELKDGEVPILAHTGEQILNEKQKMMLLKNFENAASFMPNLPDYSNVLNGVKMVEKSNSPTIHFNGGITIEKCDSPDELAKGIMHGDLALALGQRLGRR